MPTSSSSQSLVGSQYTKVQAPYVDVRRFSFVREQRFDVRHSLRREDIIHGGSPSVALVAPPHVEPTAIWSGFEQSLPLLMSPRHVDDAAPPLLILSPTNSHRTISRMGSTLSMKPKPPAPPVLKPLFNLDGDIIWTAGRSRALEKCDTAALVASMATSSNEESMQLPPTAVVKVTGNTDEDTSRAPRSILARASRSFDGSTGQSGGDIFDTSSMAGSLEARHRVGFMRKPLQRSAIPSSPRLVVAAPSDANGQSALDSSGFGERRLSVRSRNAKLVRQLAKQSHALQERINAMHAADENHRDEVTKIGVRMLAGLGYVQQIPIFCEKKFELPQGAHYSTLHSLDQMVEVLIDVSADENDNQQAGGGGTNTREANTEVRWNALLKQDVSVVHAREEAHRAQSSIPVPPNVGKAVSSTTQPQQQRHMNSSRQPTSSTNSMNATALQQGGDSLGKLVLDDEHITRILEEKAARENSVRYKVQHRNGRPDEKRYSDIAQEKLDAVEEQASNIVLERSQRNGQGDRPAEFYGRHTRKRDALNDATDLEGRLGHGKTDIKLLGANAVVDLKLYRRDPDLFSVTGEDTDPALFPSFPFSKEELLQPRSDGVGISLFDTKQVAEDKALTERYHQQNLSDKLERTHIRRRLFNKAFTKAVSVPGGGAVAEPEEEDEEDMLTRKDIEQWKRSAGKTMSNLKTGEFAERIKKETMYTWMQTAKEHDAANMPRL